MLLLFVIKDAFKDLSETCPKDLLLAELRAPGFTPLALSAVEVLQVPHGHELDHTQRYGRVQACTSQP